jgi:hypothetical protein
MVGLISLLSKHRLAVINDLEETCHEHGLSKHVDAIRDIFKAPALRSDDPGIVHLTLMRLFLQCADEDNRSKAEMTLVTSQLRRLRNVYTVLAEIHRRDEKLLGF